MAQFSNLRRTLFRQLFTDIFEVVVDGEKNDDQFAVDAGDDGADDEGDETGEHHVAAAVGCAEAGDDGAQSSDNRYGNAYPEKDLDNGRGDHVVEAEILFHNFDFWRFLLLKRNWMIAV